MRDRSMMVPAKRSFLGQHTAALPTAHSFQEY
jgi:hypothetical protein